MGIMVFAVAIFNDQKLAWAAVTDLIPTAAPEGVTTSFSSVKEIISTLFRVIISAAGAIFMIILIIGGIMYLTGAGNEEATGKAKKMMIDAIIGLAITLSAWAIGVWVLNQFVGNTPAAVPPTTTPTSTPAPAPGSGGGGSTTGSTRLEITGYPITFSVPKTDPNNNTYNITVNSRSNDCQQKGGKDIYIEQISQTQYPNYDQYRFHCYK
ncbi:MAG: Uncharacterized protein CEN89_154 [Candidatus Berkelbacteria bacterium Licking1014_7]|uniref:Uncharacterized protein n=1 Tax=Candidatus Berkelbacteria bacterium Licking1014_7 TaxID=2017147 RepID=A0A554LK62_9BACT|nr:MAG: Uncharacterized protein CEN89_154 [Candidatus Berkelbacteria bacterium Licking1014_7]